MLIMEFTMEVFGSILIVLGTLFCLIAAIGVLRFEDVFMRMHASTKAGTLGSGLILLAVAASADSTGAVARALGIIFFLLLTAPIAAHMIARAAYFAGARLSERTVVDEREERSASLRVAAE